MWQGTKLLPDARGKDLLFTHCMACHGFESRMASIVRNEDGWRIQLDVLNLLNTKANQITYAYGSLIRTDSLFAACLSATPPPAAVCRNGARPIAFSQSSLSHLVLPASTRAAW